MEMVILKKKSWQTFCQRINQCILGACYCCVYKCQIFSCLYSLFLHPIMTMHHLCVIWDMYKESHKYKGRHFDLPSILAKILILDKFDLDCVYHGSWLPFLAFVIIKNLSSLWKMGKSCICDGAFLDLCLDDGSK